MRRSDQNSNNRHTISHILILKIMNNIVNKGLNNLAPIPYCLRYQLI